MEDKYKVVMLPVENKGVGSYLYFVSNKNGKVGDWCYSEIYGLIQPHTIKNEMYYFLHQEMGSTNDAKKIEATTEFSLGLPGIEQPFIERYVKANGKIDWVILKTIEKWAERHSIGKWDDCELTIETTNRNEVIVLDEASTLSNASPKLWTDQDMREAFSKGIGRCINGSLNEPFDEWLENYKQSKSK